MDGDLQNKQASGSTLVVVVELVVVLATSKVCSVVL